MMLLPEIEHMELGDDEYDAEYWRRAVYNERIILLRMWAYQPSFPTYGAEGEH